MVTNEPVAVGGAAVAVVTAGASLGQLLGIYHLGADALAGITTFASAVATLVGVLLVRRKVTPTK
jgi:hypothetical protein